MAAKTLMVMGTSSSVGKSLLTAALCRIFARRGVRVAPFKAQNMSNNAAVCADGAEIGRRQGGAGAGGGIEACADMNPVLLKPEGATRSQVIVLGKPWETLNATRYYERKTVLWSIVTAALDRLRASFDLIVIEGAGSPVELNLKENDIVNMAVARYARSPVLLVGDIDKGGHFRPAPGHALALASRRACPGPRPHRQQVSRRSVVVHGRRGHSRRTRRPRRYWGSSLFYPIWIYRRKMRSALDVREREKGRRGEGENAECVAGAPSCFSPSGFGHRRCSAAAHCQFRRFRSART